MPVSRGFEAAAEWLSSSPKAAKQSNNTKLEIYGLYKYLTASPRPKLGSRPGMFDVTGRAKWDSWDSAGKAYDSRAGDVEARYLQIARELGWDSITSSVSVPLQPSQPQEPKEETYDDLDNLPDPGRTGSGGDSGMGVSVSVVMGSSDDGDDEIEKSMHAYALSGDVDSLIALLDHGTDINAADEFGYTALHLACDRGQTEVVRILLGRGANTDIKDADGNSAVDLARIAGHDDVIHLLEGSLAPSGGT